MHNALLADRLRRAASRRRRRPLHSSYLASLQRLGLHMTLLNILLTASDLYVPIQGMYHTNNV